VVEKIVHLLRGPLDASRGDALRDELLADVAPRLLAHPETHAVTVLVHDAAAAEAPSPVPVLAGHTTHVAVVSTWVDCYQRRPEVVVDGYDAAAHLVVESLYEDYDARSWPDGERSPGVLTVAVIHRPAALTETQWLHNWHDVQSPVSARLQPRQRYVRNRVVQTLTTDAPAVDGVVEEAWPSVAHVADPHLFFSSGGDAAQLQANIEEMLATSSACLDMDRLAVTTMSEYLVRT
jgi:hypothetical protein